MQSASWQHERFLSPSLGLHAGGKMAYAAIDAIGGAMSPKVVKSLRKSGKYLLYGALDTSPVSASNGDILAQTKVLFVLILSHLLTLIYVNLSWRMCSNLRGHLHHDRNSKLACSCVTSLVSPLWC